MSTTIFRRDALALLKRQNFFSHRAQAAASMMNTRIIENTGRRARSPPRYCRFTRRSTVMLLAAFRTKLPFSFKFQMNLRIAGILRRRKPASLTKLSGGRQGILPRHRCAQMPCRAELMLKVLSAAMKAAAFHMTYFCGGVIARMLDDIFMIAPPLLSP